MSNQNIYAQMIEKIPPAWDLESSGDYTSEDGLLYCGKCHTAKQVKLPPLLGIPEKIVNCLCECQSRCFKQEEEDRLRRDRLERMRRDGITDPKYCTYTFETDDSKTPKYSNSCKRYIEKWSENEKNGIGILFYGDVGTGKTFYACCIANALLKKGVSVLVTSVPTIIRELDRYGRETIERIRGPRLLVLDDLGAERSTETALERLYEIVDTRYRTGKPMIATTNLSKETIVSPSNLAEKRIYDRVMGVCKLFKVDGLSRRTEVLRDIPQERRII